MMLMIY